MNRERAWRTAAIFAASAAIIVACTATGSSASPTTGGGDATTIAVTLQEWAVVTASDTAPSGDVTFDVTNDGPEDIHEFVVIKTDLDAGDLPTDADGVIDEAGEGMDVKDEIEDIPVGETQSLTVALDAGNYVLVCNIWDPDEGEAHYQMGMYTPFSVTD
jgi:uncharacterized cupredoxin-like copper-binding protein